MKKSLKEWAPGDIIANTTIDNVNQQYYVVWNTTFEVGYFLSGSGKLLHVDSLVHGPTIAHTRCYKQMKKHIVDLSPGDIVTYDDSAMFLYFVVWNCAESIGFFFNGKLYTFVHSVWQHATYKVL